MSEEFQLLADPVPLCLQGEALGDWLNQFLEGKIPEGYTAYIIPSVHDAKGESKFFCKIDVEEPISVETLLERVVSEYSRGESLHFYAKDVVSAAYGAGLLSGTYVWLYDTW